VTPPSVRSTGLPSARPVRALPADKANISAAVTAVQMIPRHRVMGVVAGGQHRGGLDQQVDRQGGERVAEVIVDAGASAVQAHQVAVNAEHALLHALPRLAAALVHADPQAEQGTDHHAALASQR
jgi:hypothetical protein